MKKKKRKGFFFCTTLYLLGLCGGLIASICLNNAMHTKSACRAPAKKGMDSLGESDLEDLYKLDR